MLRLALTALTWLLLVLARGPASAAPLSPQAQAGRAVMREAQCNRCHAISDPLGEGRGLPPAAREAHCVDCHTWILATRDDEAAKARQRKDFPDWDRYLENIEHFLRLPDLGPLTRRVRPSFVRRFLDRPEDLRPHLDEQMIPVRLSAADKDALVHYLSELASAPAEAPLPAAPPPARLAAGQARFLALGCPTCHLTGATEQRPGLTAEYWRAMRPTAGLAPDLRHAKRRLDRGPLIRFIQDPQAVDPNSPMPKLPMSAEDAALIADYLLHTDFAAPARPPVAEFPLLDREVTWDEVFDEVLGKICVHCHMHPESNAGDGGAGNTGGLGFAGLGLDLETYAGVKAGLRRGKARVSVIQPPAPGEAPLLYQALLRRHAEEAAGGPAEGAQRLGMPLGLPPLPAAQMRLLRTWLAQGAPGPRSSPP